MHGHLRQLSAMSISDSILCLPLCPMCTVEEVVASDCTVLYLVPKPLSLQTIHCYSLFRGNFIKFYMYANLYIIYNWIKKKSNQQQIKNFYETQKLKPI